VSYIADDNPDAAQTLKDEIEIKANGLPVHPKFNKPGRMKGTREMVARPEYVVVYQEPAAKIVILRVLQQ
jgi:toxin ParE1/3/4